jgi:RNA polymerase sigma-54 factor
MSMELGFGTEVQAHQAITAQMIEAIQILGLSTAELEQRIQSELEANPALELEETSCCPRCGAAIEAGFCPACRASDRELLPVPIDDFEPAVGMPAVAADDTFDPMTLIASEASLTDQLLTDLATLLTGQDLAIADYLLNSLDERGFLDSDLAQVALLFGRLESDIEQILHVLQGIAPVGMAARSVSECLLLQLDYLERSQTTAVHPVARQLVAHHLKDLAAHRHTRIGRSLGVETSVVIEAHAFIRAWLSPYPMPASERRRWRTPVQAPVVAPDVVVHSIDGAFHVDVIESRLARIRLDPTYTTLASEVQRNATSCSSDDRQHIRRHVNRARFFMSAIQQRRETLRRITLSLLELQHDFVVGGIRELRPLTRCMVAERIGVHESTVSRATANKYIMLPNRRVLPFSTFFTASLSTMDVIKEIIAQEQGVLTDERICHLLEGRGIRIARRTVAKYRSALGILPSTLRSGPTSA